MRRDLECHTADRDYGLMVDVWIVSRPVGGPSLCAYFADGRWEYVAFDPQGPIAPSLTLPREMAAVLAEGLRDERKPDVSADALADARQVRDRLLSLVERRCGA